MPGFSTKINYETGQVSRGLGLSLVKDIVESELGGSISLTSEDGCTDFIYILLNDPRSALPTGLTSFFAGARGQRIILKAGLLPATMPVNIVNVRDQL